MDQQLQVARARWRAAAAAFGVLLMLISPLSILHLRRKQRTDDIVLASLVQLDDFVASADDVELETLVQFDDLIDDFVALDAAADDAAAAGDAAADDAAAAGDAAAADDDDLALASATDEYATTATCGQHKSPNHDRVPDCTHWDQGSCGNACCVAEIDVAGGVDATYLALRAYLESGGGDGGYAKASKRDASGHVSEDDQGDYPFGFDPPLPWRFTTSATHATSGGYVDALYLSVGETGSGSKVRMSSTSTINGALGDMGQNYKDLAFLCDGLGWSAPTIKFGCGYRS